MARYAAPTPRTVPRNRYVTWGRNQLHTIFEGQFAEFCDAAAGRPLLSGVIAAHQTFGDQLRCETCCSVSRNLLSWRNSGFSIDNSVRVSDAESQQHLAQYISRPPVSLKKIRYKPSKGHVLFHTAYAEYLGRTPTRSSRITHRFDVLDSLAELTQHLPPRRVPLIRRFGVYSSRTKGRRPKAPDVAARAPPGFNPALLNCATQDHHLLRRLGQVRAPPPPGNCSVEAFVRPLAGSDPEIISPTI